jgi:hypothetical protein
MCPQNARNAIWGTQILKPSLANSSQRYSAHTFGDRILSWWRARREWALWQFCSTLTEDYPFKYIKLALWYDNFRPHALTYSAQITDKIKHESCNCNSRLRKSIAYGNCNFSATIFSIFKRLLVKPGTPEHRNTEHRNSIIPEHGTPEH